MYRPTKWAKYSVITTTTYSESFRYEDVFYYNYGSDVVVYENVSFNSSTGVYTYSSAYYQTVGRLDKGDNINVTDTTRQIITLVGYDGSTQRYRVESDVYWITSNTTYSRGDFIEYVYGWPGSYPSNGRSGNYWYVLQNN